MDPDCKQWRFFTECRQDDGVVSHLWRWAKLDDDGQAAISRGGFFTVVSAMHDARTQGFDGSHDIDDPELGIREFGDRRAFAVCTVCTV